MRPTRLPFTIALLTAFASHVAVAQGGGLRRDYPDQATVASKTAHFGSVAAKSAAVKHALEATNTAGGLKLIGKAGSFTGTVNDVYSPKGHSSVYINFSKPWDKTISGQVLAADYAKLPVLSTLKGKRVLITGTFNAYHNTHPQIVVKSASQISIVR